MLFSKRHLPLITLFFALLFSYSLTAQVADAYKKLEQKDYATAYSLFSKLKFGSKDSLVAFWGLAQLFNAEGHALHQIDSAYLYTQRATKALKKEKDSRTRKKIKKKYGFDVATATKFTRDMPDRRYKELSQKGSLQEYDTFLELYKRTKPASKTDIKIRQTEALRNAVASFKSYEDLGYLYKTHNDTIRARYGEKTRTMIENKIFPAFIAENGLLKSGEFFKIHKKHPFTVHTSRLDLENAILANSTGAYLNFATQNSQSPFNAYVLSHIESLLKNEQGQMDKSKLSRSEQDLLADIEEGIKSGVRVNCYATYEGAGLEAWISYIKRHAPDNCSRQALRSIVDYSFANRTWDAANQVLRETGSLFPEDSVWVRRTRRLTELPNSDIKPTPLSSERINTVKGDEYSIALSIDGKTLAFCGRYRDDCSGTKKTEDIFVSTWSDSLKDWGSAKLVRELSSFNNEAPLCFSSDGNTMVLFENGQIYTTNRTSTGWGAKQKFPMNLSSFRWVSDVRFGAGEQVLFFAARKSLGSSDIWFSTKNEDGKWNEPTILEAPVNTSNEDRSPFLHPDMQTLYFSSSREGGFGDLDVYKSVRLDDSWAKWSEPVNIGKAINTSGNNWGYVITTDGSKGYFSAAASEGGLEDLFSVELPKEARPEREVRTISICVIDENQKPLPNIEVEVTNTLSNKIIGKYRTPPNSGTVLIYVPVGEKYTITPVAPGRFSESLSIEGASIVSGEKCREISSRAIKGGEKTTLNADIFFDVNQSEIKEAARGQIDGLVRFAKRERYSIALGGYTDPTGTDEENQTLSQARADAVKAALVAAGMPADKITATGYGETKLPCTEATPACYAKCRRVELEWKK